MILATGGGEYDIYRTTRCWALAWALLNRIELKDKFAGLVGGMMFGPEMEVSGLYDRPYTVTGPHRDIIRKEVDTTITYLINQHYL